jgi:hypothetical protein
MTATAPEGALDMANYTGDPSLDWFLRLRPEARIGTVIPQAIAPPAGYPRGVTREQGQKTLDAGLYLDFYLWLWFGIKDPIGDLRRKLDLIAPFAGRVQRLGLDVEDNTVPAPDQGGDLTRYLDLTEQALEVLSEYPTILGAPMLYSGPWYWLRWLANSWQFKDRFPLWPADYNGNFSDVDAWEWFGGWSTALFHQHTGTSTVLGVGNLDQNSIAQSEADAMAAGGVVPIDEPTSDLNPLVVPFAHLADVVVADTLTTELARVTKGGSLAAVRRATIKKVVADAVRLRTDALGPRIPRSIRGDELDIAELIHNRAIVGQARSMESHIRQFEVRARRRMEYREAAGMGA